MIVLIAIHDLNQALRFADKVLLIADGKMQACGSPLEVINADMLRRVYGVDARIEKCSRQFDHVIVDGVAA
jgi:iron complex transport system ATP-binding protein